MVNLIHTFTFAGAKVCRQLLLLSALALASTHAAFADDITIKTNWTLNATYILDEGNNRLCMGGEILGSGKLVVDSPGGIRLDKTSDSWVGGIELRRGYVDPRATMAFGTGQILIEPKEGASPYLELGLYKSTTVTGIFENTLTQRWNVPDGNTDDDFSPGKSSILVGFDENAKNGGNHIFWQGDMNFSGSAMMTVGSSEKYSSDKQRLYMNGDVTLPETGTLYLRTWGNFYFNGNLTAWRIFAGNAWSQKYTVYLNTPMLNVRELMLYSSNCELMENCTEDLPPIQWMWSWDNERYHLKLNGRSYKTPGLSFSWRKGAMQRFFNVSTDACSPVNGGPAVDNKVADEDVWLTLTGGLKYPRGYTEPIASNCTALVRFLDNVSLRMDAYDKTCRQTFRLLPSTTKGALDVNCGQLRIEAPCSFKNITSIRVGKDGFLDTVLTNCPAPFEALGVTNVTRHIPYGGYVENMFNSVTNLEVAGRFAMTDLLEADPLPNLKELTITPDARLELPAGIVLQLKRYVRYNARTGKYEEQKPGIYHPVEMVRGGAVVVDSGDTVECVWMGTNSIYSIDYGPNWKGYSGNDTPLLRSGLAKPTFAEKGTNVWFSGKVSLRGLILKAPAGTPRDRGVCLLREKGANGRNAVIGIHDGGITTGDGTAISQASHRCHEIEPPVRVYQDQIWQIAAASTVKLMNGFSDDDLSDTHITLANTGKTMALALFGTNSLSAGSSFVVPRGSSTSSGGTLAVTGAVHLAGSMVVSNAHFNLAGHLAGRRGSLSYNAPIVGGDGTFVYHQISSTYRFTLSDALIDTPLWIAPVSGGSIFYLTDGGMNFVRAPVMVVAQTKDANVNLNTDGGEVVFADKFTATNCVVKSLRARGSECRVVFDNARYAENGGNFFYMYSPGANTVTEFNSPFNAFRSPDTGGFTFDGNNALVKFNVDLAVTNGTFRFNNNTEKNSYSALCDLSSTSQRVDRLVALHSSAGQLNRSVLVGNDAWLEIAGDNLSSTNGMAISNCVNIVKTGKSGLLFYDREFSHTGQLIVGGGLVEFATNATWLTSSRVEVNGPGALKLASGERLSAHTQLKLSTTCDLFDATLTNHWRLVLPSGVTQSVASVTVDGKRLNGGYLGNTNFNQTVTWHDDRVEGAGVIKIARSGSILRVR